MDAPELVTPEELHAKLSYELDVPVTVVAVSEDIQARGMGETTDVAEAREEADDE